METKICTKCGKELPATSENFRTSSGNADGLRGHCKECEKKYRKANEEKRRAYNNDYRKDNAKYRDRQREYNKEYRQSNIEKIRARETEYFKDYYKKNRNRLNKRSSEYYANNIEKIKKWRNDNRELNRMHCQLRRSRHLTCKNDFTPEEWSETTNYFYGKCVYCGSGENIQQEHFWPLSKGGGYTRTNIIPACRSCNASKNNKPFEEWYPTHESYSPEREAKIYQYFEQLALENGGWGRQRYDLGVVTIEVINEDL